ncbi:MAG: CPXCG motif-containing cysteine-rich protein [Gammaproteobacteria bacterium]|nr:CPXCG motif-containing cysteine-rich protein [Gammaproteobacteria bacterium]
MNELIPYPIQCPYCGEIIDILLDGSVEQQAYIEDCQVCCRPIQLHVEIDHEGGAYVQVASEDES